MSGNETIKIKPTLSVKEAPSIVADDIAKPEGEARIEAPSEAAIAEKAEPKLDALFETPAIELPKVEAVAKIDAPAIELPKTEVPKFDAPKFEAPKLDAPKFDAKAETGLPPAPQIDPVVVKLKKPEPIAAPAPAARSTRFAMLAACVAIAASFGAIGGSLGVAKFGPMIASAPPPAAPVAKEHLAEEVRALKESVAQLRVGTKALNENFAALKTTVATAGTQNGKIADALERIEKAQAEQRKAAAAPEVTGSIAKKQEAAAAPVVLGTPPTTLKPPAVPGFVLRRVYDGAALIEGRDGMIEVEPGMVAPGLGRVEAIKREDGRWVVVTARGIVR